MHQDLTAVIERVLEFEQHFEVELSGLYAQLSRDEDSARLNSYVVVNGEIRAKEGTALRRPLQLVASLHDADDRVLAVMRESVDAEGFHGFQAFTIADWQGLPVGDVARIKLYPQGMA